MKGGNNYKSNNWPLQQFRFKLNKQRNFFKKFYTPNWLQAPTKTQLMVTIALWLLAVTLLIGNKSSLHTNIFQLLLVTSVISLLAQCVAYYKSKKKNGHFMYPAFVIRFTFCCVAHLYGSKAA